MTFEDSETTAAEPGRLVAPPVMDESIMQWTNNVRFGLFGDATALLVPGEELVVEFGWEESDLAGASFEAQQVTLTGDEPVKDVVVILNRTATANIDEDNMSDATLTMTCISAPPGVTCDGMDDSSPPVPDIDVSNKLYVDIVEEQLVAVRFRRGRKEGEKIIWGDEITEATPLGLSKSRDAVVGVYLDAEVLEGTDLSVNVRLTAPEDSGIRFGGESVLMITLGPEHVFDSPRVIDDIKAEEGFPVTAGVEVTTANAPGQDSAFQRQTPPRRFPDPEEREGILFVNVAPKLNIVDPDDIVPPDRKPTVVTIGDDDYLLIPGQGRKTALDLAEMAAGSDEDLYACVQAVGGSDCTEKAADDAGEEVNQYRIVARSDATTTRAVWIIDSFLHEIKWAGFEEGDTENPIEIPAQPKFVYVAPMIGFGTTVQRYASGENAEVPLYVATPEAPGLNNKVIEFSISGFPASPPPMMGVDPTSPMMAMDSSMEPVEDSTLAATAGAPTGAVTHGVVPLTDPLMTGEDENAAIPEGDEGRTVTIHRIDGFAFGLESDGIQHDPEASSTLNATLLEMGELFSIGNDSIQLKLRTPRDCAPTITDGSDADLPVVLIAGNDYPDFKVALDDCDFIVHVGVQQFDESGTATYTSSPTATVEPGGVVCASGTPGVFCASDSPHTISWGDSTIGIDTGALEAGNFVTVAVETTSPVSSFNPGFRFAVVPDLSNDTDEVPAEGIAQAGIYSVAAQMTEQEQAGESLLEVIWGTLQPNNGFGRLRSPNEEDIVEEGQFPTLSGENECDPDDEEDDRLCVKEAGVHDYLVHGLREGEVFSASLEAGDYCLRVQIADGSINDADMSENGVIHDPVALMGRAVEKYTEEDGWSPFMQRAGELARDDIFVIDSLGSLASQRGQVVAKVVADGSYSTMCPCPSIAAPWTPSRPRDDDHGSGAMEPLWLALLAAGLLLSGVGLRRRKARLEVSARK